MYALIGSPVKGQTPSGVTLDGDAPHSERRFRAWIDLCYCFASPAVAPSAAEKVIP